MTPEAQDGGNGVLKATDRIKYKIEISNTGNTCLQEIALDESAFTCDISTTGEMTFVFWNPSLTLLGPLVSKYDFVLPVKFPDMPVFFLLLVFLIFPKRDSYS